MSAAPGPRPSREEIVAEFQRKNSTLQLILATWRHDGHRAVAVTFTSNGMKRFVSIADHEVRAVAEALLAVADREGF